MGASFVYQLEKLSNDMSLKLFKREAFKFIVEKDDLVQVAKAVVKGWHGIPLVAKSLGMILSQICDELQWKRILNDKFEGISENNEFITDIIRLTCYHIPPYLRECLAFCAFFPNGHLFKRDKLAQMWMAEGYIEPNGFRFLEDIGLSYIDELIEMNLFHSDSSQIYLPFTVYIMAKFMSFDDCLRLGTDENMKIGQNISINARHAIIVKSEFDVDYVQKFKKLRTFLSPHNVGIHENNKYEVLFGNTKLLRVLQFSDQVITELPESIGKMKHLRYLDIFCTRIKKLPSEIATFSNLEALNLKGCIFLTTLPKKFSELNNLRYFGLDSRSTVKCMPKGLETLPHLHTISAFFLGTSKSSQITVLKGKNNLRGVHIINLENVTSIEMANEAALGKKIQLEKLGLTWTKNSLSNDSEVVLVALQPQKNLTSLQISGFNGTTLPAWFLQLSNLHSVVLSEFQNFVSLPILGSLPCLKVLTMQSFKRVELIDENVTNGFPVLDILTIDSMGKLKEWNGLLTNHCPKLRVLKISACYRLLSLPDLSWLKSLETLTLVRVGLGFLPTLPGSLKNISMHRCTTLSRIYSREGTKKESIKHLNVTINFEDPVKLYGDIFLG